MKKNILPGDWCCVVECLGINPFGINLEVCVG